MSPRGRIWRQCIRSGIMVTGLAVMGWPMVAGMEGPPHEPRQVNVAGTTVYELGFDLLASFPYTTVDAGTGASDEETAAAMNDDQLPDWLRIYDDQRVLLTGYMMPMGVEDGLTTKFVMMKDVTTCCYEAPPQYERLSGGYNERARGGNYSRRAGRAFGHVPHRASLRWRLRRLTLRDGWRSVARG
ncbi:MAG: hypothetical protein J6386_01940 [Candidatus Synoicihabitans palmerolidicus]|nr:hypothetical protein [Candidatus Synoicihabitans palmerolidicus]